jgi:hypothetical protein
MRCNQSDDELRVSRVGTLMFLTTTSDVRDETNKASDYA